MNTPFLTWTIVAMCLTGVAGCGRADSSPIPSAPTSLTPQPAPTSLTPQPAPTPPRPPSSLAVDLTGDFALTFEVGTGCEQVPKELGTRTYEAKIAYYKSVGPADWFLAELTESKVHPYYPVVIEVSDRSVFVDLSDNAILEEPSPGAYLATAGYGVASVQATELSTISGSFTGFFKYCAETYGTGATDQCAVDTMVRGMCRSENSRWTLTRR